MKPNVSSSRAMAAAAFIAVSGSAMAAPSLVANGSFESTTLTAKGHFFGNVAGWSGGGDSNALQFLDFPGTADNGSYLSVYSPFPATSPDGGNFVESDGDLGYSNSIYQTINGLTAGTSYDVSFYQAAGQQAGYPGATTEGCRYRLATARNCRASSPCPRAA